MKNEYLPNEAIITEINEKSEDVRLFTLRLTEPGAQEKFSFYPGQFVMLSISGAGEMPLTLASSPMEKNTFDLLVRKVGKVSTALFALKSHDKVMIRGPYGRGFKEKTIAGKNLALIAGGLGLAPIRSIIQNITWQRKKFGNIHILIGAREPKLLVLQDEFPSWEKLGKLYLIVEQPDKKWKGAIGVITKLLHPETIPSKNCVAICVGPPLMYKFVAQKLSELGFKNEDIFFSLEHHMKCGVGLCQRCVCHGHYICKEGPVFSLEEIERDLPDAIQ